MNAPTRRHVTRIVKSFRRGSPRSVVCICGWCGPQRRTLTLAADDARQHELTTHDPYDNTIGGPNDYAYGM